MKRLGRVVSGLFSLLLIFGSVWSLIHRQDIADWLKLRNYQPASSIAQLAADATMNDYGRRLFYVSDPRLDDKAAFNADCTTTEQTIVLGCYASTKIFLYEILDSRLQGVEQVTAAHEMLHAGYQRLTNSERTKLNKMLEAAYDQITDQRIIGLMATYRQTEPGQVDNELHSILGTEVRNLPADLETYYKKYFANRLQVVGYSEKYEQVFVDIKSQVDKLDASLALRKAEIDQRETAIDNTAASLTQWRERMDRMKSSGDTSGYNAEVPGFNSAVTQYNQDLQSVRNLISDYNQLVEQRNNLALQQNELVQSLSSKESKL